MKKLIMIGGTMGVGKTTVCQQLKKDLNQSVFLDGDWCWDMNPFVVNDKTKTMVLDNITHLLNNYIKCGEYEYIIFCWVMHEQAIIDELLAHIHGDYMVYPISLICHSEELTKRLQIDIDHKVRTQDILEKSIARLPLYYHLNTYKIDVSYLSIDKVTEQIKRHIQ